MDCIRVSFLRDGKEVVWFTNYDLSVIRNLINLIGSEPYPGELNNFMYDLIDLLKFSENGD